MQIWTLGTRPYANAIADIIDPQKKYFKGKIVSREDFPNPYLKCSYLKYVPILFIRFFYLM